jgi:hypothetical protein
MKTEIFTNTIKDNIMTKSIVYVLKAHAGKNCKHTRVCFYHIQLTIQRREGERVICCVCTPPPPPPPESY